jgi:hypothetical protein
MLPVACGGAAPRRTAGGRRHALGGLAARAGTKLKALRV